MCIAVLTIRFCNLTGLQDLQLDLPNAARSVPADALARLQHLTKLYLYLAEAELHPAALSGKTKLRHLHIECGDLAGQQQGTAALLLDLARMLQLTHLCIYDLLSCGGAPAASYAALTASSCLQTLDLTDWTADVASENVWQHIFPVGMQRPSLEVLLVQNLEDVLDTLPALTRLVTWCPNLQTLSLPESVTSAELLAPLRSLEHLQDLRTAACDEAAVDLLAQLPALRSIEVFGRSTATDLLRLTQLQQLTQIEVLFSPLAGEDASNQQTWAALQRLILSEEQVSVGAVGTMVLE